MRYLTVFAAFVALSLVAPALAAAQSAQAASQVQISGQALNPAGKPVAGATVRARDLLNGEVDASTSTGPTGEFSMTVNPGSYIIEVVDDGGQIAGTSSFISAAAGTAITTTVTVSGGALSAAATTSGLVSTLGSTAARSVMYAAAAAGVAGVVTPGEVVTASPSR